MTVTRYPDFFNDVFGPVMQPGSSSHTAAPCRLGRLARDLLGEAPARAQVVLAADGSFAGTFGIMAEDRAMMAGLLGLAPDDPGLFRADALAAEAGLTIEFVFAGISESAHPNAVKFVLESAAGRKVSMVGTSTGGGMVEVVSVDGFALPAIGDEALVLVFDEEQTLPAGQLEALWAELPAFRTATTVAGGRGHLHVARLGAEPDLDAVRGRLAAAGFEGRVALLRPVLPVVRQPDRRPQLFATMTAWRELAQQRELPLWELALQYEMDASGWSRDQVLARMRTLAALMRRQTRAPYEDGAAVPVSPFKPDFSGRWADHERRAQQLVDPVMAATVRWAYGAGAGIPGVVTVPGPMGGGGGYVYAALSAVQEAHGCSDDELLQGLFVAAGVGVLAFSRTEPTGEVLGCTGEAGVCGAMTAAAIVAMVGGTPQQTEDAASLALQAFTGMPCDPMPGGLLQPCRSRILAATCMAHVFADVARAGHAAVLPLHEAIDVADAVGRRLPAELRCTSKGGACAAPEAQRRRAEFERWLASSRPQDRPPGNVL